ncbi:MAG: hypothetical protein E7253_05190 [Lachnospiraceae bacterium]|nr:hypothetical protein [Lachnospiraceae bacterium]
MNYQYFQHLYRQSLYDEIKIIGKDIKRDEGWYHILGMTLKNKQAFLCVIEMMDYTWEEEECCLEDRTPRHSMKHHMETQRRESLFLRIRELQCKDYTCRIAGASSGSIKHSDYGEAYFMFLRMVEAGWKLSEESVFYDMEWDSCSITNVELEGEYDHLPEWTEDMQALVYTKQQGGIIEQPVLLECGKTKELEFSLSDGTPAHCYINKVFVFNMWEEQEKKFADPNYKARILEHISEEEFEEMKKNCFKALEEQCPKEQCFVAIYYECNPEVNLNFYDTEYLDTIPEPREGSCSSMAVMLRPEQKTGVHGLPLKGAVIQKPVSKDTDSLEAELFSYNKKVEQKIEQL